MERHEITGILLAAGRSRRFGDTNKLLALVDGVPLVVRVARALAGAGLAELIVVTGHEAGEITAAVVAGLDASSVPGGLPPPSFVRPPLRFVHNDRHLDGMGTSVAAGVAAVAPGALAAVIAQADMPELDTDLVQLLCARFMDEASATSGADRGCIVCPQLSDGRQGNPVVWPRRLFPGLMALTGDAGGKALLATEGDRVLRVPVADTRAATDIDTVEQLAAYAAVRRAAPGAK